MWQPSRPFTKTPTSRTTARACWRMRPPWSACTPAIRTTARRAAFYSLALLGSAAASPADKTLARQKKAGEIAEKVFAAEPNHPGAPHYIIHAYDYPPLAEKALPAARRYAQIAPDAPHALHMPSHIFTRLGLWQESDRLQHRLGPRGAASLECPESNCTPVITWNTRICKWARTKRQESARPNGSQQGRSAELLRRCVCDGNHAGAICDRETSLGRSGESSRFRRILPAASCRGRKPPSILREPWAAPTLATSTRARQAIEKLEACATTLIELQETYWAGQVEIQRREAAGMLASAQGKKDEALELLRSAADMEDASEKHPVTPGPVVPARELLGEFLLTLDKPAEALIAFESTLQRSPNRFNALYGAARAAQMAGQREKARQYFNALVQISDPVSSRAELRTANGICRKLRRNRH